MNEKTATSETMGVSVLSLPSLIDHHLFQRAPYDHADVLAAHTPILIVELRGSQVKGFPDLVFSYDGFEVIRDRLFLKVEYQVSFHTPVFGQRHLESQIVEF